MSDLDLARRAVACLRWRWMEGMRIAAPAELLGLRVAEGSIVSPAALPDLDDPATVGCLEALDLRVLGHDGDKIVVHVQWGVGAGYRVMRCRRLSRVSYQGHEVGGCHDTKIAALVAALESAP